MRHIYFSHDAAVQVNLTFRVTTGESKYFHFFLKKKTQTKGTYLELMVPIKIAIFKNKGRGVENS